MRGYDNWKLRSDRDDAPWDEPEEEFEPEFEEMDELDWLEKFELEAHRPPAFPFSKRQPR